MRRAGAPALAALLVLAGCGGDAREDRPAGPLRYVALGDSYSNGEGASPRAAWPRLLAHRLTESGLPVRLSANLAESGWTSDDARRSQLPRARDLDPDVVSILIGANDWFRDEPAAAFRADLRALLHGLVGEVGDPRRVLLVTIPDFSVSPVVLDTSAPGAARRAVRRFNAIVAREARRAGVTLADVAPASRRMGREPSMLAPDGLHPSARMLRVWAAEIAPAARRAWAAAAKRPGPG